MRAMSVLAERHDPAIDDALNRYTDSDSGLLRVHAASAADAQTVLTSIGAGRDFFDLIEVCTFIGHMISPD